MRWRNYGLWASIASLLYMFFRDMGLQIDLTQWETYVNGILGVLVALGIISNPEASKGYFKIKKNVTGQTGQQMAQNVQNQFVQNEMTNQNQQMPTNEPSIQNSASYGVPMTSQNNSGENAVNQQLQQPINPANQQGQMQQTPMNQQDPVHQQNQVQPNTMKQQQNMPQPQNKPQTNNQPREEVEAPPMEQIGAEHNERW
ncbi:hypothetical protein IMZ08_13360 [Bacillus luteolus]|uniref:Holin n=1 Tax=Litchfieldia luteola TaxID=682179 RepID=A0ABR9QKM2_9BACI|nr:hypothetical protein [Cytobacillus luteolus]MBE4909051.1 hypothetical protein [Cytobacillus luteolus]MBP1941907.1 putative membrane protein [Cytobacillus luteolus]